MVPLYHEICLVTSAITSHEVEVADSSSMQVELGLECRETCLPLMLKQEKSTKATTLGTIFSKAKLCILRAFPYIACRIISH